MKLTIKDGRDHFYTFDTNRILLLTATDEENIRQVEFSTEENGEKVSWTSEVLTGSDGVKYVQVPNEFLNGDYTRLVCYYVALDSNGEYTRQKEVFRIRARQEPQDYFLTYSERVTFASIKALTEQYKATTKQYMDTTEGFKNNASGSAELARKYAENNEDVAVEPGKYSAKHWSIKAEAAKETAVQKATEAGTSEVNSKTYMESAQSAKQNAETAKNDANTILEQVQSKGTEITNFVATSKTEIETQKNESVNAVKSVYQTDLNELKGDLGDLNNNCFENVFILNTLSDTKLSITKQDGYYTNNYGTFVENASYDTYTFSVDEETEIYFPSGYAYLSLCLYNAMPLNSDTNVGGRYRDDTIPTQENPLIIPKGYYVAISISHSSDTLSFYCDYKSRIFNGNTPLASEHISQVINALELKQNKMYVSNTVDTDKIIISTYTKIDENKKLRIDIIKYIYPEDNSTGSANSNVWVMGGVYVVNNEHLIQNTVVLPVEWDCAIKEVGASDFMGGKQHGDEIYQEYYVYADGKLLTPISVFEPFYCDCIELIQYSKLNRVGSPTDYMLNHTKHIKIERNHVFCEQSFKALQTFEVGLSYTAMLPISPSYATRFIRSGKAEIEEIDSSYVQNNTKGNHIWANIISDNGTIRYEVNSDSTLDPIFSITNGSNDHKCYYSCNNNNSIWESGSKIVTNYDVVFNISN